VKIETVRGPDGTIIRLVGRLSMEHLPLLIAQIDAAQGPIVLEMSEVTLVDIDVVQFLIDCQTRGIQLRGCSAYIREWIALQRRRV
jgi:anti-anti-sigma regulatory factor